MFTSRVKILLSSLVLVVICFSKAFESKKTEAIILNEARESFVKIIVENESLVADCTVTEITSDACSYESYYSEVNKITGSGIIINHRNNNYILSVDHICDKMIEGLVYYEDKTSLINHSKHSAMTLEGIIHSVEILKRDEKNDLCLLEFKAIDKYNGIDIYENNLIPGERVYNLAAPKGIFEPENVLIFDGFFTGNTATSSNSSMFSIYAKSGSSGSAIINNKGELVSIVHSVSTKVDNVTVGTSIEQIREFLKNE